MQWGASEIGGQRVDGGKDPTADGRVELADVAAGEGVTCKRLGVGHSNSWRISSSGTASPRQYSARASASLRSSSSVTGWSSSGAARKAGRTGSRTRLEVAQRVASLVLGEHLDGVSKLFLGGHAHFGAYCHVEVARAAGAGGDGCLRSAASAAASAVNSVLSRAARASRARRQGRRRAARRAGSRPSAGGRRGDAGGYRGARAA